MRLPVSSCLLIHLVLVPLEMLLGRAAWRLEVLLHNAGVRALPKLLSAAMRWHAGRWSRLSLDYRRIQKHVLHAVGEGVACRINLRVIHGTT